MFWRVFIHYGPDTLASAYEILAVISQTVSDNYTVNP